MRDGVGAELSLERREMLHHECCQESILSEREQILLVQRIDIGLRVLLDDTVGDDDGPSLVGSADTIQRETTGQTRHRAEQTLESLGQVMGDVVFVDLDHRPPRALFVREFCFTTNTDDAGVISTLGNQSIQ